MVRTALLVLALALGGGAPYFGSLVDFASVIWAADQADAGGHFDPDGAAAPSDAVAHLDPNG